MCFRDEENHLRPDARSFKSRPRKLLSDDGERVLNLWFIPHYTDLLTLFKKSPDAVAVRALTMSVRIMGALNDCLQFLLANAIMTVTLGKGISALTSQSKHFSRVSKLLMALKLELFINKTDEK